VTFSKLSAPFIPFLSEEIWQNLVVNNVPGAAESVHLCDFPVSDPGRIDPDMEKQMDALLEAVQLGRACRNAANLKVRQPLAKIVIPVHDDNFRQQLDRVKHLICSELNIKDVEFLAADNSLLVKRIKPNFKTLGPRYGKIMKAIAATVTAFSQQQINALEAAGRCDLTVEGQPVELLISDVEIATQDIPGWVVANEGSLTVALDITLTQDLVDEGIARELVNRIQNIRKDGFDVTDRIVVSLQHGEWDAAVERYMDYICSETLTEDFSFADTIDSPDAQQIEIIEGKATLIQVRKK
jgi:isoleucyl-tRNA synthetase